LFLACGVINERVTSLIARAPPSSNGINQPAARACKLYNNSKPPKMNDRADGERRERPGMEKSGVISTPSFSPLRAGKITATPGRRRRARRSFNFLPLIFIFFAPFLPSRRRRRYFYAGIASGRFLM